MAFSAGVEVFNIMAYRRRRKARQAAVGEQ
jgi:hypothetical protein